LSSEAEALVGCMVCSRRAVYGEQEMLDHGWVRSMARALRGLSRQGAIARKRRGLKGLGAQPLRASCAIGRSAVEAPAPTGNWVRAFPVHGAMRDTERRNASFASHPSEVASCGPRVTLVQRRETG
jgi:hypothetical protein